MAGYSSEGPVTLLTPLCRNMIVKQTLDVYNKPNEDVYDKPNEDDSEGKGIHPTGRIELKTGEAWILRRQET